MIKNSVKDDFGRSFILIRRSLSSPHTEKANPLGLSCDPLFVRSFMRRLRTPMSYWQWVALEFGLPLGQSKSAEEWICEQVVQRRLQFVEVTSVLQSQDVSRQVGKLGHNKHVDLVLPLADSLQGAGRGARHKVFKDRAQAQQYLESIDLDTKRIKELVGRAGGGQSSLSPAVNSADKTSNAISALADALVSGRLLLLERESLSSPPPRSESVVEEPAGAAARPPTLGPHESGIPVKAWVEIQLLDDMGEPIAGEAYWIQDPDGAVHQGQTNAKGMARVSGISPGNCQVAFPNVDGGAINQCSANVNCCKPAEKPEQQASANNSAHARKGEAPKKKSDEPAASDAQQPVQPQSAPPPPEKSSETCGTCTVKSLEVQCAHKRAAGPAGVLQVVPSPNTTEAEEISAMGVKIVSKKESGGSETLSTKLTLDGNKFEHCHGITNVNGELLSASSIEDTVESPVQSGKWLPRVAPEVYTIAGQGCASQQGVQIEVYPSDTYTIEGNLDIFKDWADDINEAWEKWGKKLFDLSPLSITPKITGPTGQFSAAWGWKEDSDWQAYYDVAVSFGLNPILGVEIEASFSMLKLAATAAGIPPNLADLSAEHLADIAVFVGAGCKGSLMGSPHAKLYPSGKDVSDGEAKFTVEGNAKVGIKGRVGSDYIASATLIVQGETKVIGEDVVSINREGVSVQSTVNLEPFTATAKVEIKYLVIFSKSKEKKWTPWDKMELYKSEPKKLLE